MIDLGTVVRFKMDNTKARVTFAPIIAAGEHLHNWKPVFISKTKGTRWKNVLKVEKRKFKKDEIEFEIERRIFPHCVLYSNQSAWMTKYIFGWECDRLSNFLRVNHPNRKFLLLLDNATCHQRKTYDNLDIQFFPAKTSGYLQLGLIYRSKMHLKSTILQL